MKSSSYWKERFALLEQSQNRKGKECYAEIEKQYRRAEKELDITLLVKIVRAFKEVVLAAGYDFGLYMGKYYYESKKIDVLLQNENVWLARYYKSYAVMPFGTVPEEKYKPETGKLWGWQFTSCGRVDGIQGNVDMDIAYYDIKDTDVEPSYYETPEFTLIDALNKIGVDSSYNNRKKIAAQNGIKEYSGTAEQNIKMLQLLNEGKLKKQ